MARNKTSTGLVHVIKSQERHFWRKKRRLRQCITHTQGIQIPGTSFFPKKKRLRQCITHTQGIKIPGTSFFQKKKRLRQCITHTHTRLDGPRAPPISCLNSIPLLCPLADGNSAPPYAPHPPTIIERSRVDSHASSYLHEICTRLTCLSV